MFNRKLKQRITELEDTIIMLNDMIETNSEAIDLLADEMGAEIKVCDCCGKLLLDFGNGNNEE